MDKLLTDALGPLWKPDLRFALVRYGGGIVQMSGSIAGNTFARNRSGNYTRARTKPVNPRSGLQANARLAIMYLTEYWHETLTEAQRLAWRVYADMINWNNKLGEVVHLTGFNHFVRSNAARFRAGLAEVDAGPVIMTLPSSDTEFAATASAATQKLHVLFAGTDGWNAEDGAGLIVHMGRPQQATRNFFNGPWRFADSIDGNSGAPPGSGVDIDPPFVLVEGHAYWVEAMVTRADGRLSNRFRDVGGRRIVAA